MITVWIPRNKAPFQISGKGPSVSGWLLNQFKASDLFREMAAAQSLRNEMPFAFTLDDRLVHGVVDALYQSAKGQWVVVDFKTDRIEIEDVDKRTEEYLVQLGLYQAGMQMALGKPHR